MMKYNLKTYLNSSIQWLVNSLIVVPVLLYSQNNPAEFVNPFIGTGGHGHTFPGAVWPFGMVQLSPDTRIDGSWDGCSGYHYSDRKIYGFSHTHLSGTGCSDWGDILLMPATGSVSMKNSDYASAFDHKNESASAGYYSVLLDAGKIRCELTVTPRVGIHRYSFPKGTEMKVLLDLLHRDKTLSCGYKRLDSFTVSGYRISEAWAREQQVYFAIRFSKPIRGEQFANALKLYSGIADEKLRKEGACFSFGNSADEPLMVKVAISPVSEEGALNNLDQEAPHWIFDAYMKKAQNAWNEQLSKIKISETNRDKASVFYTALYHCCIHPSLNMDVDGKYRGRDKLVHQAKDFVNYSVFSLWDTYRALHPLFTLIERKRTVDFIQSFLVQYQQSGRLPMWELSANETDCMIGYHSVSVIADAYMKGIRGFDTNLAYEAMKAASNYSGYAIPVFNAQGYLQVDDESESVSKSLEYAYDDWCIAQMANALGQKQDEELYLKRSLAYLNLFDTQSGHMRPRKNGNWIQPFYPEEINNHFTEGNSWQYSFYAPHDLEGLISLHGGDQGFEKKLDELFTTSSKTRGREQADVTGLIGQYAHGNEPSHHMAYLYNYVGKPQKTIALTQRICREFYTNAPDGLIGNEDCGQMSAWYVFSALGFYPVCPGSVQYVLSAPLFSESSITTEEGKRFVISSSLNTKDLIKDVNLNGKTGLNSFIEQQDILNGGNLSFNRMSSSKDFSSYGQLVFNRPRSNSPHLNYLPAPLIQAPSRVFSDSVEIAIAPVNTTETKLYYTTNGSPVTSVSSSYSGPFHLTGSAQVRAKLIPNETGSSPETKANFFKIKHRYKISIPCKANAQYAADGTRTLIDGIYGSWDWRRGDWLGYQGQDLVIRVDLLEEKTIQRVALNCLQDSRSWILFPKQLEVYASKDSSNYVLLGKIENSIKPEFLDVSAFKYELKLDMADKIRYLKFVATYPGKLPDWHPGAGGESFIFTDELEIE